RPWPPPPGVSIRSVSPCRRVPDVLAGSSAPLSRFLPTFPGAPARNPAAPWAVAAGAAAQRVLDGAQGELALEGLDRRVEGVRHGDVDGARPVGVGARALAAAERLVVRERVAAEREVVHRALAERAAERGE